MIKPSATVSGLVDILPYIQKFRDDIFVVKLGGEMCVPEHLEHIVTQLAVLQSMGIKVIVVHGGGPQLNAMLKDLKIQTTIISGRRVTDERTLDIASMVFGGIQTRVAALFRSKGVKSVGLSGVDGGLIIAEKRPPRMLKNEEGDEVEVDFGYVGDVIDVDPTLLESLLESGFVPVISSLGFTELYPVVNINADTIASKVAQKIKAAKLIVVSNVPGILRDIEDKGSVIPYLGVKEVYSLIEKGVIKGGMLPKVTALIDAVHNGVQRTHIIAGAPRNCILNEVFLSEGLGTMIMNEDELQTYISEELE